jgi:hypothetical protein
MGHGRPRTAIGTFGGFTFVSAPNGKVKARVRYRDDDGRLRLVQATGVGGATRSSEQRAVPLGSEREHGTGGGVADSIGGASGDAGVEYRRGVAAYAVACGLAGVPVGGLESPRSSVECRSAISERVDEGGARHLGGRGVARSAATALRPRAAVHR